MEQHKLGRVPLPGEDKNLYSSEATWWQTQEPTLIELQAKEERIAIQECTQKKLAATIVAKREKKNNPFRNFCEEHLNIEDMDWKWIYTNFKRLPTNMRIRSFSWKLVHGLCYTASRLKHFGYRDTNTCTLCDSNIKQDKSHYFFECPNVIDFWESVETKFQPLIQVALGRNNLTFTERIIGIKPHKENDNAFLNLLIVSAQKLIYECHCFQKTLVLSKLLNILVYNEKLERYNSSKIDQVQRHLLRFEAFNELLATCIIIH